MYACGSDCCQGKRLSSQAEMNPCTYVAAKSHTWLLQADGLATDLIQAPAADSISEA